ncbi:MAG: DUF5689 domain-containing protein [Saprospiraceae bacterium]|nr:DUF5689 domain-containing protein [Saprospiraceae bacterium]
MKYLFQKLLILFLLVGFTACIDQEFDEPPVDGVDPGLTANATIAELKALYKSGTYTPIEQDLVVKGVVVADDRSGNYFRSFILQDASAGIEILINLTNAYNFYPVGRELFIKCQGLVLGEYNGVIQLGGYVYIEDGAQQLGDIQALDEHIIKGKRGTVPEPKIKTINTLGPGDISTLVRLENVEFAGSEVGLPISDQVGRQTLNRTVLDCNGGKITLRTSGFAIFANKLIPEGNGTITAIYSVFGTTKQLYIRDYSDIVMNDPRCSGGGSGNEAFVSIKSLRDLFKSGTSAGPANTKIKGIVISDKDNNNWDSRNLVVQDSTGGIAIRFANNHTFALGQEIEVITSGQELSEFNGLLQVNGVDNGLAKSNGAGTLPTPREATAAQVLSNLENWESTLVKIKGATIAQGTYSGSKNVTDGSGSVVMFTRSQATFAGQAVPSGTVDVTAVVSQFNSAQLVIRNTNDVSSGGGGNPGGNAELLSIKELRDLFKSGTTAGPANKKIKGVVISDKDNNNWDGRNLVIQDSTAGIVVRFQAAHTFAIGQEVEVSIGGQELSEFNGLLQVNNVAGSLAKLIGPGTLPTPREATINQILTNLEAWESTLVKIKGATIASGTFSGSKNVTDSSGTVVMFTRSQASFSAQNVPSGTVEITAVVSQFNTAQIVIRSPSDIK